MDADRIHSAGNPTGNTTNVTLAWKGQPAGGLLETKPDYAPRSSFDRQSLNLGLLQEMIELDLFYYLLANFTSEDWQAAGLTEDDRTLTQHMANQEVRSIASRASLPDADVRFFSAFTDRSRCTSFSASEGKISLHQTPSLTPQSDTDRSCPPLDRHHQHARC